MKPAGWFVCLALFFAYFQGQARYLAADGSEITLMNIDKVWAQNITGKNIIVAVVDDGVNYNHADLKSNYKTTVSYDFVAKDNSPMPDGQMAHGTKCAGIIASRLRGNCRTGVAYNAKLAGIRVFNGTSPNENRTAAGFRYKQNEIDIYSNSWGPSDNGYFIKSPGLQERQALEQGVKHGRGGLGSIFVFSSGNGGFFGDSCAFDGYVNNINTIAIGAFSKKGIPRYAEFCSAVMAATYGDYVKTCSGMSSRCVDGFGRTSAAAAFASGIIALLLEANNKLTQRDVQHLIVRTSNPRRASVNRGKWSVNGAGLMVHPAVGFGVMNAKKLVDVARKNWNTVPQRRNCSIKFSNLPKRILRRGTNFTFSFKETNECSFKIEAIEHVEVEVSLNFSPRAIMEMYIISPYGTRSQLLYKRTFDALSSRKDYKGLVVASLHFWGENPAGEWTVLFKAAESMSSLGRSYGTLQKFGVTIYGTEQDPLSYSNILPKGTITCGNKNKFWKGYGSECCGSLWTYDPDQEICCRGTYEIVKKISQCGSTIYNKCKKICCNGVLRNKFQNSASMSCCGRKSYDKNKKICCNERVYKRYTCKWNWWRFDSFIHETRCSMDGTVRAVFVEKLCRNLDTQTQQCRDKMKKCYYWYDCTSAMSKSHKIKKCAKTCGFC